MERILQINYNKILIKKFVQYDIKASKTFSSFI